MNIMYVGVDMKTGFCRVNLKTVEERVKRKI
jgi:hypothetical protein